MSLEDVKHCHSLEVYIPNCIEQLVFAFNDSFADIILHFVDKHKKQYLYFGTTDAVGELVLDINVFPKGLFNPYAGNFMVYATFFGLPNNQRIFFRDDSGYYPSMLLHIDDTVYTNFVNTPQFKLSDGHKFNCCCTENRPCGNFSIDPCTGDGTGCELCCGEYNDFLEVAQFFLMAFDAKEAVGDGSGIITPNMYILLNYHFAQFTNTEYYIDNGNVEGEYILYKRVPGEEYPLNKGVPAFDCYLPFKEGSNDITNSFLPLPDGEIISQCVTFSPIDAENCNSISICWDIEAIPNGGVLYRYNVTNMRVCMGLPDIETGSIERCKQCLIPLSQDCSGIVYNGYVLRDKFGEIINPPYVFTEETNVLMEIDFTIPPCCRDTCYYIRWGEAYHEGQPQLLDSAGFTYPYANPIDCPTKIVPIWIAGISPERPWLDGNWLFNVIIETVHCGSLTIPIEYTKDAGEPCVIDPDLHIVAQWQATGSGVPLRGDTSGTSVLDLYLAMSLPDCCGGCAKVVPYQFDVLYGDVAPSNWPDTLPCNGTIPVRFVVNTPTAGIRVYFGVTSGSCPAYLFTKDLFFNI